MAADGQADQADGDEQSEQLLQHGEIVLSQFQRRNPPQTLPPLAGPMLVDAQDLFLFPRLSENLCRHTFR